MADQAILREYMVALGYKIDQAGQRKFNQEVTGLDKRMSTLGKTVVGVAAATTAFVTQFALGMEKLYYSSKRTGATIGNIKALEYGGRTIGLTAETIRGSLENMARALRSNPGLTGLLNNLGVSVKGRDMSDVVTDMVAQLKKMPFFVAERYAAMFGMDPDTLFMMAEGLDKMKASASAHKDMAKDMGVDLDKASESAIAYNNALREMSSRAELLGQSVAIRLIPHFVSFTTVLNENLGALTKWINKYDSLSDAFLSLFDSNKNKRTGNAKSAFEWITSHKDPGAGPGRVMTEEEADAATNDAAHERLKKGVLRRQYEALMRKFGSKRHQQDETLDRPMTEEEADAATNDAAHARLSNKGGRAAELFARLEKQYGLPSGLLDRVWAAESNRGDPKYMLSNKGAKGHMGFMDPTAKQYGVTDPNDLEQSASGSARMWADRLKARGGDLRTAAADYNWGQGNVDKYGLKNAPRETRGYMDKVAGPTIEQHNHVTVTGVRDPDEAASKVGEQINIANRDVIRNNIPRVR